MNPENVGEQIKLRHSSLWRKPLHFEKPVPESEYPKKQLNERTSIFIQSAPRDKVGDLATTSLALTPQASEINQH